MRKIIHWELCKRTKFSPTDKLESVKQKGTQKFSGISGYKQKTNNWQKENKFLFIVFAVQVDP